MVVHVAPVLRHVLIYVECAVAAAAVNAQLFCLRQREKGKLCLCREVVQEAGGWSKNQTQV